MLISAASSRYVGALSISRYVVTCPLLGTSHLSITRYDSLVHYSVISLVHYSVHLRILLGVFPVLVKSIFEGVHVTAPYNVFRKAIPSVHDSR